jgi:hypothetical protein
MEMTAAELARMRTCFSVATTWCGWTEEEQAEIGAEIRAAIDSGDEVMMKCWRDWLEDMSGLEHMKALCRAAEARIKASRRAA